MTQVGGGGGRQLLPMSSSPVDNWKLTLQLSSFNFMSFICWRCTQCCQPTSATFLIQEQLHGKQIIAGQTDLITEENDRHGNYIIIVKMVATLGLKEQNMAGPTGSGGSTNPTNTLDSLPQSLVYQRKINRFTQLHQYTKVG